MKPARRRKAQVVEAYPVDEDSPSYRSMGFVPAFERRGFVEAGQAGSRPHVMRLRLRSLGSAPGRSRSRKGSRP